jgi:RNA polymerase sigma factor (sigma-70 family)
VLAPISVSLGPPAAFLSRMRAAPRGLAEPQIGVRLDLDTDRLLLERLRQGDRAAFHELARVHGPWMRRLAHRLSGWKGEADDVVQEVFAKLIGRPERIARSNLKAWLTTVTANECRSFRRRTLARVRLLGELAARRRELPSAVPACEDSELYERVRRAIGRLPVRDRQAIVLHYLEQMNVDELCEILSLARNAVEVRLHRARARLREELGVELERQSHGR